MIKFENKVNKIPATEVYVKFGLESVGLINARFDYWLSQQTFAGKGKDSHYAKMTFDPSLEFVGFQGEKYEDNLRWELNFSEEIKDDEYSLSSALLHEHRLPNIITLNSAPDLFTTADYTHVSVSNGERGWVKNGEFPIGVYIVSDPSHESSSENPVAPKVPASIDIKRDSLIGFNAAYEWQKFRAMASACSDVLEQRILKEEESFGRLIEEKKIEKYDAYNCMRSLGNTAWPVFLSLLPDTRLSDNSPSSLKSFYFPGALEGAVAFELEKFTSQTYRRSLEARPISYFQGQPISIIGDSKQYAALINLNLNLSGFQKEDWEKLEPIMKGILGKYGVIEFESFNHARVSFHLEDANKIDNEIREGNWDTDFNKSLRNFGETLYSLSLKSRSWNETQKPLLEQRYANLMDNQRIKFFSDI